MKAIQSGSLPADETIKLVANAKEILRSWQDSYPAFNKDGLALAHTVSMLEMRIFQLNALLNIEKAISKSTTELLAMRVSHCDRLTSTVVDSRNYINELREKLADLQAEFEAFKAETADKMAFKASEMENLDAERKRLQAELHALTAVSDSMNMWKASSEVMEEEHEVEQIAAEEAFTEKNLNEEGSDVEEEIPLDHDHEQLAATACVNDTENSLSDLTSSDEEGDFEAEFRNRDHWHVLINVNCVKNNNRYNSYTHSDDDGTVVQEAQETPQETQEAQETPQETPQEVQEAQEVEIVGDMMHPTISEVHSVDLPMDGIKNRGFGHIDALVVNKFKK